MAIIDLNDSQSQNSKKPNNPGLISAELTSKDRRSSPTAFIPGDLSGYRLFFITHYPSAIGTISTGFGPASGTTL